MADSEKIRYVYTTEILLNTATIREANSTEIDSSFTARETQDHPPLQRQATNNPTKLSQLQNTQLNLLKAEAHDATNRCDASQRQVPSSALILRQVAAIRNLFGALIDFGREEM